MKVDGHLTGDWTRIPEHIKTLESEGFDGVGTAEMKWLNRLNGMVDQTLGVIEVSERGVRRNGWAPTHFTLHMPLLSLCIAISLSLF